MASFLILAKVPQPSGAPAGAAINRVAAQAAFVIGPDVEMVPDDGRALWAPPPIVPLPIYVLPTLAWRGRLTDAEIGGVTLAASKGLERGDPTLQVFLDDLGRATVIDVSTARLHGALDFMVSAGLLDAARIPTLLAPATPEELA